MKFPLILSHTLLRRCIMHKPAFACCSSSSGKPQKDRSAAATARAEMIKKKTPKGRLDQLAANAAASEGCEGLHPDAEKQPLSKWPEQRNPDTGEVGGPAGPEPTRYQDWERKGRVTDF